MPPKPAAAVIAALVLLALTPPAGAGVERGECRELLPLFRARSLRESVGRNVSDWAAQEKREWEALETSAANVFDSYLRGRLARGSLSRCLPLDEDRELFETVLPSVFFSRSLQILAGPLSPPKLRALARGAIVDRDRFLFRLSGYFIARPPGAPALGGFHRGSGSIFLDFEETAPREWLLIFVHELIHASDSRLREAIARFNHDAPLISEDTDPSGIQRWLLAGLNRGYLAEARAWTLTAEFYADGIRSGLWTRLHWMDEVLSACASPRPGMPELLTYLDPGFEDPREGVFSFPKIKAALKRMRDEIRQLASGGCRAADPLRACEPILLR